VKKILVVRFSSIGDIILTSPVVRCIKTQRPEIEIHYLIKQKFASIVETNPNIDKVYTIEKDIGEVMVDLKNEAYDFVVDLHQNLRTKRLKLALRKPSRSFPKLNFKKFLLTNFKVNTMPKIHIVDRYFKPVKILGIKNDLKGLDYFIPSHDLVNPVDYNIPTNYIVYAIGAQYATKKMPLEQIIGLISRLSSTPFVLLGGEMDKKEGKQIAAQCQNVIDLCGQLNLNQSASLIQQADKVITHDTGLMHIAAAFQKPIISIWGNTSPDLGMYPYLPQENSVFSMHEVDGLKCRPCSKIGYQKCPKGHFDCMVKQDLEQIAQDLR